MIEMSISIKMALLGLLLHTYPWTHRDNFYQFTSFQGPGIVNGRSISWTLVISTWKMSVFMILRLVYLILIAMGQINTKYEMLALLMQWEMRRSFSYSGMQMCTEYKWHSEKCSRKGTYTEWAPCAQAGEWGGPSPFSLHCFSACQEKTSVSYLNGTLDWRSPELVSSLFNFRKWCHNALNNSAGWFIFPWTRCPKHSSSLAMFPINCKLECSSYFIMILRSGGRRLGMGRGIISEVAEVQS